MGTAEALAGWAGLLADRTRASFCLALLDGRAWTVSELARHAGVALSTASEHADRLVTGGLVEQHRQGRNRYLRVADPEVAALIEAVAAAAGAPRAEPVVSLAAAHRRRNLAAARTCYDHLAGVLGVALANAMTAEGLLSWDRGLALTERGAERLTALGVNFAGTRRPVLRSCLDWTERRPHLAGAVGAALCRYAFDAGWIVRVGTGRAVKVTPAGQGGLAEVFGVVVSAAEPGSPAAVHAAPGGGCRP